jgi:hypothetical protein
MTHHNGFTAIERTAPQAKHLKTQNMQRLSIDQSLSGKTAWSFVVG